MVLSIGEVSYQQLILPGTVQAHQSAAARS